MAIATALCWRSADRRRVLETALVPELVEAAGNSELGAGADIAIKALAVIADGLHDPHHPILGQAELFAEIAVAPQYPFQLRVVRFHLLVDVLLGNAEFFGRDHREQRPLHDVEPLIVAMAHHWAERLLRNDFG